MITVLKRISTQNPTQANQLKVDGSSLSPRSCHEVFVGLAPHAIKLRRIHTPELLEKLSQSLYSSLAI